MSAADIVDPDVPQQILAALNTYNVIVFPQLSLTDEEFATLTAALGDKHELTVTADTSAASRKGIYRIALDKDDRTQLDYVKGNDYWHMDGTSYTMPGKATLLKCESPPTAGGDTEFANLFAAYEAMPDARRRTLAGLRVVHCLAAVGRLIYEHPSEQDFARWNAIFPPREHSLVWHQKDGRTSMLIGSTAESIVGLSPAESKTLLADLLEWSTMERFTYRHRWKKGDLVMFNNPGLLHRSRPFTESAGRVLHRTTIKGVEAVS